MQAGVGRDLLCYRFWELAVGSWEEGLEFDDLRLVRLAVQ